jgi:hypothetical protein
VKVNYVIVHVVDIGGIVDHHFKLSSGERGLFMLLILVE